MKIGNWKFEIGKVWRERRYAPLRVAVLTVMGLLCMGALTLEPDQFQRNFNSVAELVQKGGPRGLHRTIYVLGYYAPGDGGGGIFTATNSVTSTNTGTRVYSGTTGWSWERIRPPGVALPEWFGGKADGATDAIPATQAANNSLMPKGGTLWMSPGDWVMTSAQLVLSNNVTWKGFGKRVTRIDFSAGITGTHAVYASGSYTALPTISVAVAVGQTNLTFGTAHNCVSGDVILIHNTTDFSYNLSRAEHEAGEFYVVESAPTATTLVLSAPSKLAYGVGANIVLWKLNGATVGIDGMSMKFRSGLGSSIAGIMIDKGRTVVLRDLYLEGSQYTQASIWRSYDYVIEDCEAWENNPSVGNNYGIIAPNSSKGYIKNMRGAVRRHVFGPGGAAGDGCIVTWDIKVEGGYFESLGKSWSLDFGHGNVGNYIIEGVDAPSGIALAGDGGKVMNSLVGNWNENGTAVVLAEIRGANFTIENNTLRANRNFDGGLVSAYVRDGHQVPSVFVMRGNKYEFGPFRHSSYPAAETRGVEFGVIGTPINDDVHFIFENEEVSTDETTAGPTYAYYQTTGARGIKKVTISGLKSEKAGIKMFRNSQKVEFNNLQIRDALQYGLYTPSVTSPTYSFQEWSLNNSLIEKAKLDGVRMIGASAADDLTFVNNRIKNNGQASAASSIVVVNARRLWMLENLLGDDQAAPTQNTLGVLQTVTSWFKRNNENVGRGINALAFSNSGIGTELDLNSEIVFLDPDNNFAATTLNNAIAELDNVNGSGPNAADGKVDWSQIVGMPGDFADGNDNDAGATAIHTDAPGEIAGITLKVTPDGSDLLVIEDSADSFNKKRVQISSLPGGGGGADADAIHDNVAGEIVAIADKATPVAADHLLIEDSAASNAKKDTTLGALPISTATQSALDLKAPLASPTFSGTVTVPDNSFALGTKTTGNYAAGDAEAGAATSGDSATGFFPSGQVETDRIATTLNSKTLLTPLVDDYAEFNEESAPATPGAAKVRVYAKADGKLYSKDDAGTEYDLTATGGSGGDADAIHDNVAGEIAAITDKVAPVAADHILIEDSAASDAKKDTTLGALPISTATQTALDLKAPLASPTFSGTVTVPDNSFALGTKTTGNYAAGDAEAGAALTGDSATGFFPTGQVETDRIATTLNSKTLLTPLVDDYAEFNEESAPATPGAAKVRVYAKADGKLYSKDDAGTEYDLTASGGGGGGGKGEIRLQVQSAKLPSSNPAVIDASENDFKLLFDDATDESVTFTVLWPSDYASDMELRLVVSTASDTSTGNNYVMVAEVMYQASQTGNADFNTDSYDTANTTTVQVDGTAGDVGVAVITLTNADGITGSTGAGVLRVRISRDANHASDTATGDVELRGAMLLYTRD